MAKKVPYGYWVKSFGELQKIEAKALRLVGEKPLPYYGAAVRAAINSVAVRLLSEELHKRYMEKGQLTPEDVVEAVKTVIAKLPEEIGKEREMIVNLLKTRFGYSDEQAARAIEAINELVAKMRELAAAATVAA